MNTLLRKKR